MKIALSLISPRIAVAFSSFDVKVIGVVALLVGAILVTVLVGDNVGVRVLRAGPTGEASGASWVTVQFSEEMARDTVAGSFGIEPTVDGELTWSGSRLIFRPSQALSTEQLYTVVLQKGARSASGRELQDDYSFIFKVRGLRLAYLYAPEGEPENIWITNPDQPSEAERLTDTATAILNFDVSPDGSKIAFAEEDEKTSTYNIKSLELNTGEETTLVDCPESNCAFPVWHPDGNQFSYERVDYTSAVPGLVTALNPPRIWLLDLTTDPPTNRRLMSDSLPGYSPHWSPDGSRIALATYSLETGKRGMMVYEVESDRSWFFETTSNSATFTPDGNSVVFSTLESTNDTVHSTLNLVNLQTGERFILGQADETVDDKFVSWNPDGSYSAVIRKRLGDNGTQGHQVYIMDSGDGTEHPVGMDTTYDSFSLRWSPSGDMLAIERRQRWTPFGDRNPDMRPEIWVHNPGTGEMTLVAGNASSPKWIP